MCPIYLGHTTAKGLHMTNLETKSPSEIRESEIEKYLKNECEKHNWLYEKVKSLSGNGFPDRCIIADGRVIFVELKRPNHKPRKLQVRELKKLLEHGAEVCVVHDMNTANTLVYHINNKLPIKIKDKISFYIENS